ncbi:MAG: hypothetical protein SOV61_00195 [Lachnospiraceae bacterium]|nr:hypothetical protein [Lachnospiraceae bacterium]
MPDGFGRFIVGVKAAQEGERKMDLEKPLEIQRKETSSALRILLGYADKLAVKNLDKNRESLEQLKKFSLNMAQFFCVEGHEHGCDERIMEKYVQPYEKMLAGDKKALAGIEHDNISKDNMEEFLTAIGRYKMEMLNDYNPVYDEDLGFCDKILKDIVYQYVYDSDVYQRMMAGREVARMQEAEGVADIAEAQTGPIMQGM